MALSKPLKITIFLLPVLIGGYLIYKQFARKTAAMPGNYVPPPTPQPTITPIRTPVQVSSGCSFPLKQGVMNCDLVKKLQWALNNVPVKNYASTSNLLSNRPLVEDGDFGPKTQAVLNDFWGEQCSGNCVVENEDEMNNILAFVVTDPVKFQEAENPYIQAPAQPSTPPLSTYFPQL